MNGDQPRYRLILRSEASSVPAERRLARLLKVLLRGYCFRCEHVQELPAEAAHAEVDRGARRTEAAGNEG